MSQPNLLLLLLLALYNGVFASRPQFVDPDQAITQGEMRCASGDSVIRLPLLRTEVHAQISGLLSRVSVQQIFVNTNATPIEAEYLFPLGERSAVDSMEFRTPDRVIRGVVKSKEQAERDYQQAKESGKRATVLHQVRDNLFRQKIANLMPGDTVQVRISYLEELDYDQHTLRFKFPMTVGPYYNPASTPSSEAAQTATQYITPTQRDAATVSLKVDVLAATGMQSVSSPSHRIRVTPPGYLPIWSVTLGEGEKIPNKDFMLEIPFVNQSSTVQALVEDRGAESFLHLTLYPPTVRPQQLYARELIFVVDVSGSMRGFPLDKSKQVMENLLKNMRPSDRFRVVVFAGGAQELNEDALPASPENRQRALDFVDKQQGGGGTEFMAALNQIFPSGEELSISEMQRNVLFLTDGYVGNEREIIANIRDRAQGRRVYTLGVGSSVNHSLLRGMAEAGGGYYAYLRQDGDAEKSMREFYARTDAPLLTGLQLESPLLDTLESYPRRVALLTSERPIQITTKLRSKALAPSLYLEVSARTPNGSRWNQKTQLQFVSGTGLASLWARKKVAHLELYNNRNNAEIESVGVQYQIMTSLTSFVAVEEQIVNKSGKQQSVSQPSQAPEGVDMQSAGGQMLLARGASSAYSLMAPGMQASVRKSVRVGERRGKADGAFNSGYAESGSGGIGDQLGGLMGGGSGSISTKAKGRVTVPAVQEIALGANSSGRSSESISNVMRARAPGLRHIYKKYLMLHPGFHGKVVLKFTIAASGEITAIAIESSTTGIIDFDNEIKDSVSRYRFIIVKQGSTVVTLPFTFSE